MHLDSGEPGFEEVPIINHSSWWGPTQIVFWSHHLAFSSFEVNTHPKWYYTFCSPTHFFFFWNMFTYSLGNYQLRSVKLGSNPISQTHPRVMSKDNPILVLENLHMVKKSCVSCQRYNLFGLYLEDQQLQSTENVKIQLFWLSWHWTAHFSKIIFTMDSLIILLIFDLTHI